MCDFSSTTLGDDHWVIFTHSIWKKSWSFFIVWTNIVFWKYLRCVFAQLMFNEVESIKLTRRKLHESKKSNWVHALKSFVNTCWTQLAEQQVCYCWCWKLLKVHFVKCGKRFEGTCSVAVLVWSFWQRASIFMNFREKTTAINLRPC